MPKVSEKIEELLNQPSAVLNDPAVAAERGEDLPPGPAYVRQNPGPYVEHLHRDIEGLRGTVRSYPVNATKRDILNKFISRVHQEIPPLQREMQKRFQHALNADPSQITKEDMCALIGASKGAVNRLDKAVKTPNPKMACLQEDKKGTIGASSKSKFVDISDFKPVWELNLSIQLEVQETLESIANILEYNLEYNIENLGPLEAKGKTHQPRNRNTSNRRR